MASSPWTPSSLAAERLAARRGRQYWASRPAGWKLAVRVETWTWHIASGTSAFEAEDRAGDRTLGPTKPRWAQAYKYTGRQLDPESSAAGNPLYYYRARYYDPATGRFGGRDPIGVDEDPNLYRYVRNQPVGWKDPRGEEGHRVTSFEVDYLRGPEEVELLGKSGRLLDAVWFHFGATAKTANTTEGFCDVVFAQNVAIDETEVRDDGRYRTRSTGDRYYLDSTTGEWQLSHQHNFGEYPLVDHFFADDPVSIYDRDYERFVVRSQQWRFRTYVGPAVGPGEQFEAEKMIEWEISWSVSHDEKSPKRIKLGFGPPGRIIRQDATPTPPPILMPPTIQNEYKSIPWQSWGRL